MLSLVTMTSVATHSSATDDESNECIGSSLAATASALQLSDHGSFRVHIMKLVHLIRANPRAPRTRLQLEAAVRIYTVKRKKAYLARELEVAQPALVRYLLAGLRAVTAATRPAAAACVFGALWMCSDRVTVSALLSDKSGAIVQLPGTMRACSASVFVQEQACGLISALSYRPENVPRLRDSDFLACIVDALRTHGCTAVSVVECGRAMQRETLPAKACEVRRRWCALVVCLC
jgi:hypothetical protein